MRTAADWIERLQLTRHPEGGWYREVYRAAGRVLLPAPFHGERSYSTAIYFLLEDGDFSALHRIRQDEVWHHYDGAPVTIHAIDERGEAHTLHLGEDPVVVVPAGWLFGATVEGDYALTGATVAPGFEFADFEMPARAELLAAYPEHSKLIERLSR